VGGAPELLQQMLPALMRIQAHLEEDLSLETLAAAANLSEWHFLRRFQTLTGETPKQHVLRLRVERAAYWLLTRRAAILDVALDCGFRSHETFTRAFRRILGTSPRSYRDAWQKSPRANAQAAPRALRLEESSGSFTLSRTVVRELKELPIAFIRHTGPYEQVPAALWDRLIAWGARRRWASSPLLFGIAHDAPGITPPERCRFDAAMWVPEAFTGRGDIGFQVIPGGPYGITTHLGPYATLEAAYRSTFTRLSRLRRYRIPGFPAVEAYASTRIDPVYGLNRTEVCLPLERRL
jgi:AraC family transcriptional regulator